MSRSVALRHCRGRHHVSYVVGCHIYICKWLPSPRGLKSTDGQKKLYGQAPCTSQRLAGNIFVAVQDHRPHASSPTATAQPGATSYRVKLLGQSQPQSQAPDDGPLRSPQDMQPSAAHHHASGWLCSVLKQQAWVLGTVRQLLQEEAPINPSSSCHQPLIIMCVAQGLAHTEPSS